MFRPNWSSSGSLRITIHVNKAEGESEWIGKQKALHFTTDSDRESPTFHYSQWSSKPYISLLTVIEKALHFTTDSDRESHTFHYWQWSRRPYISLLTVIEKALHFTTDSDRESPTFHYWQWSRKPYISLWTVIEITSGTACRLSV
jgi:hypothetical protein